MTLKDLTDKLEGLDEDAFASLLELEYTHDIALSARLCRQHNDANVLAMGGRMIGEAVAKECVEVFLSTKFDGGRHQKRVDKLRSC